MLSAAHSLAHLQEHQASMAVTHSTGRQEYGRRFLVPSRPTFTPPGAKLLRFTREPLSTSAKVVYTRVRKCSLSNEAKNIRHTGSACIRNTCPTSCSSVEYDRIPPTDHLFLTAHHGVCNRCFFTASATQTAPSIHCARIRQWCHRSLSLGCRNIT